jgi:predicted Zn-dependent protease
VTPIIYQLGPQDRRHLDAAQGWLGLGNVKEAELELKSVGRKMSWHPEVLEVQWKIHSAAENWALAADVAEKLTLLLPFAPHGHTLLARALRRLGRVEEACNVLMPIVFKFPREWRLSYDLACYTCQLGKHKLAGEWLARAMEVAGPKEIKRMATEETDLEPLWEVPCGGTFD